MWVSPKGEGCRSLWGQHFGVTFPLCFVSPQQSAAHALCVWGGCFPCCHSSLQVLTARRPLSRWSIHLFFLNDVSEELC